MDLATIKKYYGDKMSLFEKNVAIEKKLSDKEKEVLFEIGLPNYSGYAGSYIMQPKLEIVEDRYLKFATRKNDEKDYFRFIDLKTKNIVFKFMSNEYHYLNADIESYLKYIYIISTFSINIKNREVLGDFISNSEKYAAELERQLLQINDDVKKGAWSALIEEMGYGLV